MSWLIGIGAVSLAAGLFWYGKKRGRGQEPWPRQEMPQEQVKKLLANHGPLEIAAWLDENFTSREELWPNLKGALEALGLEGVFLSLLNSQEPQEREGAFKGLALIGTEKSLPLLLEALAAKDDELSLGASLTLKKLKLPESAPLLVEALLDPIRILPARSAEVLLALGKVGLEAVMEALPKADTQGKMLLIEMLGEYKNGESLEILSTYLTHSHEEIRAQAVMALGNLELAEAGPLLLTALEDPYWKARAGAARALGRLKYHDALTKLEKLTTDPQWHVRTSAQEALEQLTTAGRA